jgi:polyphosphate kinase 2 (PPK2 family)
MSIKKYRYNGEEKFKINDFDTSDKGDFKSREEALEEFVSNLKEINKLQQKLYAARQEGVVFVFQAMDAAGKDGCIRTVFSTLTPHGVKEYCFNLGTKFLVYHRHLEFVFKVGNSS